MMLNVLILSVVILGISFLLLGFNIFFRKRKFPEYEVGHNRNMHQMGITCVRCEEIRHYRSRKAKFKINPGELKVIS